MKKRGKKWQLCLDCQIIAENGQKISKFFLGQVLDTLCMNWNKLFEKNKNDKIWRFLGNFLKKTKKISKKWKFLVVKNMVVWQKTKTIPKNENFWS